MSTFGREEDARWYEKRHRETGDAKYLKLAEETMAWLQQGGDVISAHRSQTQKSRRS